MKTYFYNLGLTIDQFFNALSGGSPEETVSSRLGKAADRGNPVAHVLCHIIGFFLGSHHCQDAEEPDEGPES